MKKRSAKLRWIGLALAGLGAAASGAAMASAMQVTSDGGIKVFNPNDTAYWFSVGGRLDLDETIFSGDYKDKRGDFPSGAHIRRAFIKFMGGVGEYLSYNMTFNFNGSLVRFEDAWLNYAGLCDNTNLRVGQFTPLTTIDNWGRYGTVNDTIFLEPSLASTTFQVPTKALGIWADTALADLFTVAATVYQPRQNADGLPNSFPSQYNYQNPNRSDRLGAAMRITFSPVHTEDTVYHIGALGRFQSMNNIRFGRPIFQQDVFATYPEARARNTAQLVETERTRAKSYNVITGEALAIWGPLMLEGEYSHANMQRMPANVTNYFVVNNQLRTTVTPAVGNVRFYGWHAQVAYVITGETRGYDFATGTVQNPSPAGSCGAWEIAARYSNVKLNDKNLLGGRENNVTVGLNWFINDNVRIAANYIRANIHPSHLEEPELFPAGPMPNFNKRQLDIFGLRFGVQF